MAIIGPRLNNDSGKSNLFYLRLSCLLVFSSSSVMFNKVFFMSLISSL